MRINIYLEKLEKKKLCDLKEKYHLSFSTIGRIITETYYLMIPNELEESYIYGRTGYKTSIRPKKMGIDVKKVSVVYTNAIKMFLKGDIKKYISKEKYEKSNNMIYTRFQNEYDEDWNGNKLHRLFPKYIKQNPEYYRKLIENEK